MDLKKAVALAMKGEIEGRELYRMASLKTEDGKAKEVFAYLAEEENKHYEWLRGMYESPTGFEMPRMEKLARFEDASSPIFSREFKNGIGGKHFEMSALSIAVRLELEASRFYKKTADECEDKTLKTFFSSLAEWENGHYRALNQEIRFLEDEYFQSNNFSPF
jgi:rubrerythrin